MTLNGVTSTPLQITSIAEVHQDSQGKDMPVASKVYAATFDTGTIFFQFSYANELGH